jgi:hypothetical protein
LDREKEIKKEAKQLAKENNWDKLHALLYLRSKYENENLPKRQPLLVNSYMRKKLMKSENMMVFNQ